MGGKKAKIADPEFAKRVAELYLAGLTREQISNELSEPDGPPIHRDTISDWTQDPRVQVHISAGSRARENRIKRRIDKEIEGRITGGNLDKIPIEVLLKIRKELGGTTKAQDEDANAGAADAWDMLDANPELAEEIVRATRK